MKLTPKQIHHLAQHTVTAQGDEIKFARLVLVDPVLLSCGPECSNGPEDADAWESLTATLQDVLLD